MINVLCLSSGNDLFNGMPPSYPEIQLHFSYLPQSPLSVHQEFKKTNADIIVISAQPEVEKVCKFQWIQELPTCLFWYDAICYKEKIKQMSRWCFNAVFDDQNFHEKNIIPIWTPLQPDCTKAPCQPRDIDVTFLGGLCTQRNQALHYILNRGINVFTAGNDKWNFLSREMMTQYLERSKIVLNFSFNKDLPIPSLKGRVFEGMCAGALVIEDANDNTTQFFNPGEDLIHYSNHKDLLEKIQFFLSMPQERMRIASNGQNKCTIKYNIREWWKTLLSKLKLYEIISQII